MKVTGSRVQIRVTEQALYDRHVHACFQEVCGKAVSQKMYIARLVDSSRSGCDFISILTGGHTHGALTLLGRKKPVGTAMPFPVVASLFKHGRGKHGVAILVALASFDPNLHPFTVDMAGPQIGCFSQPHPGAINRHQEGTMMRP